LDRCDNELPQCLPKKQDLLTENIRQEIETLVEPFAVSIAKVFRPLTRPHNGQAGGALELSLGDYFEFVVDVALGVQNSCAFFQSCFLRNS